MSELIDFRDLNGQETQRVLAWRNDPEVRKWMYRDTPISLEEHRNFLNLLKHSQDKRYFLVRIGGEAIGVVYLTDIDFSQKCAHIGIYADPRKRKVGGVLMEALCGYAFATLGLNILRAEVFCSNIKAISLYEKFGFKTGIKTEAGQKDILRMELLKS